jgi:hypothetical protein
MNEKESSVIKIKICIRSVITCSRTGLELNIPVYAFNARRLQEPMVRESRTERVMNQENLGFHIFSSVCALPHSLAENMRKSHRMNLERQVLSLL